MKRLFLFLAIALPFTGMAQKGKADTAAVHNERAIPGQTQSKGRHYHTGAAVPYERHTVTKYRWRVRSKRASEARQAGNESGEPTARPSGK